MHNKRVTHTHSGCIPCQVRDPSSPKGFQPLLPPEHPGWSRRARSGDGDGDTPGSPGCGAVGGTGTGARGNPGSCGEGCGLSRSASWVPPSPSQAVPRRGATGRVTPELVCHGTLISQHSVLLLHPGTWRGPWSGWEWRRLPALPEHRDEGRHPEFRGAEAADAFPGSSGSRGMCSPQIPGCWWILSFPLSSAKEGGGKLPGHPALRLKPPPCGEALRGGDPDVFLHPCTEDGSSSRVLLRGGCHQHPVTKPPAPGKLAGKGPEAKEGRNPGRHPGIRGTAGNL